MIRIITSSSSIIKFYATEIEADAKNIYYDYQVFN